MHACIVGCFVYAGLLHLVCNAELTLQEADWLRLITATGGLAGRAQGRLHLSLQRCCR